MGKHTFVPDFVPEFAALEALGGDVATRVEQLAEAVQRDVLAACEYDVRAHDPTHVATSMVEFLERILGDRGSRA